MYNIRTSLTYILIEIKVLIYDTLKVFWFIRITLKIAQKEKYSGGDDMHDSILVQFYIVHI